MVHSPTRVDADKPTIFRDLFVTTADDNYITARLAASTSALTGIKAWMLIHAGPVAMALQNVSPHI